MTLMSIGSVLVLLAILAAVGLLAVLAAVEDPNPQYSRLDHFDGR